MPRKSTSMSTNQPNPLAPALAPRSGANTSILTGLARFEEPLAEAKTAAVDTPIATSSAATANLSLLIVALLSLVSEECLPRNDSTLRSHRSQTTTAEVGLGSPNFLVHRRVQALAVGGRWHRAAHGSPRRHLPAGGQNGRAARLPTLLGRRRREGDADGLQDGRDPALLAARPPPSAG